MESTRGGYRRNTAPQCEPVKYADFALWLPLATGEWIIIENHLSRAVQSVCMCLYLARCWMKEERQQHIDLSIYGMRSSWSGLASRCTEAEEREGEHTNTFFTI